MLRRAGLSSDREQCDKKQVGHAETEQGEDSSGWRHRSSGSLLSEDLPPLKKRSKLNV